jgi:hypothetical protein
MRPHSPFCFLSCSTSSSAMEARQARRKSSGGIPLKENLSSSLQVQVNLRQEASPVPKSGRPCCHCLPHHALWLRQTEVARSLLYRSTPHYKCHLAFCKLP